MERIIQSLRARRLDAVAVAYAVASWGLVQGADIILPTFDAPAWSLRALIIFLLIGFPFALAITWFAMPHIEAPRAPGKRRIHAYALLGVSTVVTVLVAADLSYLLSQGAEATPQPRAASATGPAANSIAVLPFDNMSGDPSKDYFSDGVSEELLNDLANVPALRVAARTSSFAFKNKNENIKTIARTLGVRSILEGSVRASGTHLRITATLVDAAHGYTLWSESYDRDLTDVLIVESEIAKAITTALAQHLVPGSVVARTRKPQTIDPEAYRAYLRGKYELAPRTKAGAEKALPLFEKVTELAPEFAEGFAALARTQTNLVEYDLQRRDLMADAHAAVTHALALDPQNIEALSAHLDLSLFELNWNAAVEDALKMQALNPNSAAVLHEMFRFYLFLGFPNRAIAAARGATALNPLSIVDHLNETAGLLHDGRYAETQIAAQSALDLAPAQPYVRVMLCNAAAHGGDLAAARNAEARLAEGGAEAELYRQFCQFQIAVAEGRRTDAKAITDRIALQFQRGGPSASDLAENYAMIGDNALALHWLERAYADKEYLLFLLSGDKRIPKAFFASKDWKAFYARALFVAWRKAHDRVAQSMTAGG